MTDAPLYVYGVMRAGDAPDLSFKAVSAPDAAPRAVICGDIQALVSAIDVDEVLPARRNLLAHAKGLEQLMQAGPLLPMRFGLIAPNAAAVEATMIANQSALLAHIEALSGCAEFGVRVAWTEEAMMREVVARNPALRQGYEALAGRSEAATHYERVELGRRVQAGIGALREEEAARCAEAVGAVARQTVRQEPEDDVTILKMDCLMETARADDLAAVLERFQDGRDKAVEVKLVGPAPAYNFTNLALEWAEAA